MKREIAAFTMALALACAAAGAAQMRDGGVIRNSGSTNFSGYTIKVWSDGATWAVHSMPDGSQVGTPVTGTVPAHLAQTFLHDAQQARANPLSPQHCMKSTSFGTTSTVRYHGWTSPDLECASGGFTVALAADMHKIVAALKFQGMPAHSIHLPVNEPRRVPSDMPSGQASPTPEPEHRAS